ncbi:MAG TPA: DUF4234 domain-containing protein [Deltaproteobacteria bacterium]|nr:DUF4234 domain-containing protein [Deltaproteobacteria bacterium]
MFAEEKTGSPAGLERMGVLKLFFLVFITGGIYTGVWFLKRLEAFNALNSEVKLKQAPFTFIIAGCVVNIGITFFLMFAGKELDKGLINSLLMTGDILNIVVAVVLLVQAFKLRRILMEHFNTTVSWLGTFFFTVFYLQYRINRLTEEVEDEV